MPAHQLFVVLSAVLLLLAGFVALPWPSNTITGWSLVLGWFGACAFVISTIVT